MTFLTHRVRLATVQSISCTQNVSKSEPEFCVHIKAAQLRYHQQNETESGIGWKITFNSIQ